MSPETSPTLAVVDLGSNSFHLVIARLIGDELQVLDRLREPVRLAAGLDDEQVLDESSQQRAAACLRRFGERLGDLPPDRVRAVGTNTLRLARNALEVRLRAERALGHPIDVVSGQEEARLIYLGVSRHRPLAEGRRLVVDVGGGSTEIVVGQALDVLRVHSLFMGCVGWTERFFGDGQLTRERFRQAELAARLELRPIAAGLGRLGWGTALGSSGTVGAMASQMPRASTEGAALTLDGLKRLRRQLVAAGTLDRASLPGLRPDRLAVLPGGLAILIGVFRSLPLSSMAFTAGSLREGVLYDLAGRLHHQDARDRTIQQFVRRYHVDLRQVHRIERTGLELLQEVAIDWDLDGAWARQALSWSAHLREIGLTVSHTGYHKHSAYLVQHADMPGFSAGEQRLLGALVRGHRRKLSRSYFASLGEARTEQALRLCVVLRLAARLHRSRRPEPLPALKLSAEGPRLRLAFPAGWLDEHPLTRADLDNEASYLAAVGLELVVEG